MCICISLSRKIVSFVVFDLYKVHCDTVSVRPEFTDTIAIKQGRHPILEKITVNAIMPNNVVTVHALHCCWAIHIA